MDNLDDPTHIDLGDDLLEITRTVVGSASTVPHPLAQVSRESIAEHLQNARILLTEGFATESKRILRKILIVDPSSVTARRLLEDIHTRELEEILRLDSSRKPRSLVETGEIEEQAVLNSREVDALIASLDEDLKLGLDPEDELLNVFRTTASLQGVTQKLIKEAEALPSRELIDQAIAFREMGLFPVSLGLLSLVQRRASAERARGDSAPLYWESLTLILECLNGSGRCFEAVLRAQEKSADPVFEPDVPTEFLYQYARALEASQRAQEAKRVYECISQNAPTYRDVKERLRP